MAEFPYRIREGQDMHSTPLIIPVATSVCAFVLLRGFILDTFDVTYILYLLYITRESFLELIYIYIYLQKEDKIQVQNNLIFRIFSNLS
jgi:hypothetical protein